MKQFVGPLITVFPLVVHQTRFEEKACSGFAQKYEEGQGFQPDNFFHPPHDGKRNGKFSKCIDRARPQNRSHAVILPCPVGTPSSSCQGGVFQDTPRWKESLGGSTVYPKLILDPVSDVLKMQTIQWIDAHTGAVVLSVLAYTEGLEVFTRVSIKFEFNDAGGVNQETRFNSWKKLRNKDKVALITCSVCVLLLCLSSMGLVFGFNQPPELNLDTGFEVLTKALHMLVVLFVMVCALSTNPTSNYETAMEMVSITRDPASEAGSFDMFGAFFTLSTYFDDVEEMTEWITIFSYVTACVHIVQIVKYLHVHPGTAVLSATVIRAFERLFYLLFLFAPLFLFLSFVAFCLFGYELPAFATYGDALTTHLRMAYGDFVQASRADGLNPSDTALYWIHALVFMLATFILLRFTFLAVVVDAFTDVVRDNKMSTAHDTLFDVADSFLTLIHFRRSKWPSQEALAAWLTDQSASESDLVTPERFSEAFDGCADDLDGTTAVATAVLEYYLRKVPMVNACAGGSAADGGRSSLGDAAVTPDQAPVAPRVLDGKRLAQQVVHEVTYRLTEKNPDEIDRFVTIGLLSCTIAREFRKCGLIKPENY
jgi:hypothetical protein